MTRDDVAVCERMTIHNTIRKHIYTIIFTTGEGEKERKRGRERQRKLEDVARRSTVREGIREGEFPIES